MTQSMTAYATQTGSLGEFAWVWELRSVNGKGLDLRVRVPDWIDGLEPAVRSAVSGAIKRGNTQASLRVTRTAGQGATLSAAALDTVMAQIKEIEAAAQDTTLPLVPASAVDILGLRSLHDAVGQDDGGPELAAAVKADIESLVAAFVRMRGAEGAALNQVIERQLDRVTALVDDAAALLPDRAKAQENAFRAGMARVLKEVELDDARLAQELALLAIKSDVTEEIDRLRAHISAAKELLFANGPVGRKFDFLMQEFNREANTLCSKSADSALTAIGLDLKVAIDQMREQIQNVE